MEIPLDRTIYESELAEFWFHDDGILCCRAKAQKRSVEKQKKTYDLIHQILGDRKLPLLVDANIIGAIPQESRTFTAEQMGNYFTAMAIYATNPMGKLVINSFLTLTEQPIPVQMFHDEHEAREWLRNYL